MAEVHVLGAIESAMGFLTAGLYCKFHFVTKGSHWSVASGAVSGQTQTVEASGDPSLPVVWAHPVDVHFACSSLAGWPQLSVEVYQHDSYGRNEIAGYGTAFVPLRPGQHAVEIVCWRPSASTPSQWLSEALLGALPRVADDAILTECGDRSSLFAVSTGSVNVTLNIITRGFDDKGVTV